MNPTYEKIALVQCYINHKKNIEVDIIPPKNARQHLLLEKAYMVANEFFNR